MPTEDTVPPLFPVNMRCSALILLGPTLLGMLSLPVQAASLEVVKVVRLVDGKEIFVDGSQARVNQIASKGSVISSRRSRAELLFDRRAIGLLGKNTLIKIGSRCFSIDSGAIVVNGPQRACIGSRILGVRGTTYVLARESDSTYTVSVLSGESVVANDLPDESDKEDILNKYPKVSSWLGVQAGGFGSIYPAGGGNFIGGISGFTPIWQNRSRSILYSSTSVGSSFLDQWGVATELGYRHFMPSNQSTTSLYLGYSGYGLPGCFSNMVNLGGQWEKSRWRIGASGGVKVNECPAGLSYGAVNLGIPVGSVKDQPVHLLLSPYVLTGNAVGTGLLDATNSNLSPGFRASLEVPFGERLSMRGYVGADAVFGVTAGGYFSYKLPAGKSLYIDPNSPPARVDKIATSKSLSSPVSSDAGLSSQWKSGQAIAIALEGRGTVVSDLDGMKLLPPSEIAQDAGTPVVIPVGNRARFSSNGDLLAIEPLSDRELTRLIKTNLEGQNILPESRMIAKQVLSRQKLSSKIAGILGTDFLRNASLPISSTVDTPFSPITAIPAGRYVCASTNLARIIGARDALPGQFDYNTVTAYFGRGSKASQGLPVTGNKSDAYVFSDPGVCSELNRLANQGYDVVRAEKLSENRINRANELIFEPLESLLKNQ